MEDPSTECGQPRHACCDEAAQRLRVTEKRPFDWRSAAVSRHSVFSVSHEDRVESDRAAAFYEVQMECLVGEQVNWSGGQARAYAWQVRVRCRESCIMNVTDHRRWDKQRDIIKVLQLRLPEMPRHSTRLAVGLDGTRNRPSAWTSRFVPPFVVECGPVRSLGRFCPFLHKATRDFGEGAEIAPSEWSLRALEYA